MSADVDPYTAEIQLCDDDGIVRSGAMHHGTDYPCTGHAHWSGQHIRCTGPSHRTVAWIAGTDQRVCGNCGHPVDAPLPWSKVTTYPPISVASGGPLFATVIFP